MNTIALRFGEHFAPSGGTVAAHQAVIEDKGYVWYGKLGSAVSDKNVAAIMEADAPKILLINSGKADRYWANVAEIRKYTPDLDAVPEYYRNDYEKFKTWFKIVSFEPAPKDIMSQCVVASSGAPLSIASKHSMSPYFAIEYNPE